MKGFQATVGQVFSAFPAKLSLLLPWAVAYLFFWYVFAFVTLLWTTQQYVHAVALAVAVAVAVVSSFVAPLPASGTASGVGVRFFVLSVPFIAAVAIAKWYGHDFGSGLLGFTQWCLHKAGIP